MKFFQDSQMVHVSLYDQNGWWKENTEVYVAAGTALPTGCTENTYTPIIDGQTGRYSPKMGAWSEHEDKTGTPYWTPEGVKREIKTPDGILPGGCVAIEPPEHNLEKQFVVFEDDAWQVRESHFGKPYWDEHQAQFTVTDPRWECPVNYTLIPPPTPREGYGLKLINRDWVALPDYTGTTIWHKSTREERVIQEVGEIFDDQWTMLPPPSPFYHTHNGSLWIIDMEALIEARKSERDSRINSLRWRIERHRDEVELNLPFTEPIQPLLQYIQDLRDIPQKPGFPWLEGSVPWPPQPSDSNK